MAINKNKNYNKDYRINEEISFHKNKDVRVIYPNGSNEVCKL